MVPLKSKYKKNMCMSIYIYPYIYGERELISSEKQDQIKTTAKLKPYYSAQKS